jgi:hypothetical protein
VCWGSPPNYGEMNIPAGYTWKDVSAENYNTCGVTTTGLLKCMGWNDWGQVNVPAGYTWTGVGRPLEETCGVTADGTGICWGNQGNPTQPLSGYHWLTLESPVYGQYCGLAQ